MSAYGTVEFAISNMQMWPEAVDVFPMWTKSGQDVEHRLYVPERESCRVEAMNGYTDGYVSTKWFVELSCHTLDAWEDEIPPRYCPYCGKRVVDE